MVKIKNSMINRYMIYFCMEEQMNFDYCITVFLINFYNLIIFLYGRIIINLLYKVSVVIFIYSKRVFFLDFLLTFREKEILDKIGEIGVYDNFNFFVSRFQDSICSLRREFFDLGELFFFLKLLLLKNLEVIRR